MNISLCLNSTLIQESEKCLKVFAGILGKIKDCKKVIKGTPYALVRRRRFASQPFVPGDVDLEQWFIKTNQGMMELFDNLKYAVLYGQAKVETVVSIMDLVSKMTRGLLPPYREGQKKAAVATAEAAAMTAAAAIAGGQELPPAKRERKVGVKKVAVEPTGLQVLMKELAANEDYNENILKLFKKDGLPEFLQMAAESKEEVPDGYAEAIKTEARVLAHTLKSKVENKSKNGWPLAKIRIQVEELWRRELCRMKADPNNKKIDILFRSMHERASAWEEDVQYLCTKGEKARRKRVDCEGREDRSHAPAAPPGPSRVVEIVLDGEVEILDS